MNVDTHINADNGDVVGLWVSADWNNLMWLFFYFPNGRYIDCLSLTYATSKGKMLKLHYKYKRDI
jgi:hypothetical protein